MWFKGSVLNGKCKGYQQLIMPTFLYEMNCTARQMEEGKTHGGGWECAEIRRMLLRMERYVFTTKLNF